MPSIPFDFISWYDAMIMAVRHGLYFGCLVPGSILRTSPAEPEWRELTLPTASFALAQQ